jgi:hypothetical protein
MLAFSRYGRNLRKLLPARFRSELVETRLFFCLILAVVTMLAYQPVWNGGFIWDGDNL